MDQHRCWLLSVAKTLHGTLMVFAELAFISQCTLVRHRHIILATRLAVTLKVYCVRFHSLECAAMPQRWHCMCHTSVLLAVEKRRPEDVVQLLITCFQRLSPVHHVVAANRPNTKLGPSWEGGVQRLRDCQVFFHGCPVLSLCVSLSLSRPYECCIFSRSHQECPLLGLCSNGDKKDLCCVTTTRS